MNLWGSGFITIIIYAGGPASITDNNVILTEDNNDLMTENSIELLKESS